MYVHAYYCGHMVEQMNVSANITLPFGDLINADFCRCIEILLLIIHLYVQPSVFKAIVLPVWLAISLSHRSYKSLLFTEILVSLHIVAKKNSFIMFFKYFSSAHVKALKSPQKIKAFHMKCDMLLLTKWTWNTNFSWKNTEIKMKT